MSRTDTLKSLEIVLESFLDRAVALKEGRLRILGGINRLDDIAALCRDEDSIRPTDLTDRLGGWFADYGRWIDDQTLRTGDRNRIGQILAGIGRELKQSEEVSPATRKIASEIDRWQSRFLGQAPPSTPSETTALGRKIVLRKGPESSAEAAVHPSSSDSIGLFEDRLAAITALFKDVSGDRRHLMSVLDDALKSAQRPNNREALLLSALIIYYLKQNGYMVQPFVKRLKEAERLQKREDQHA